MVVKIGDNNNNTLNGSSGADTLRGRGGNDLLRGKDGDDQLFGGDGNDKLYGGIGNDTLTGGAGNDLMVGGDGSDSFIGGGGIDTVSYASSQSAVKAYLGSNISGQGAAGDTYSGMEKVIGSAFGDLLQTGNGGTAFGGGGDDTLYGASYVGTDGGILRGDGGYDTLRMDYGETRAWVQNGQGYDTISLFVEGDDLLFVKLSDFGLGNNFDSNEIVNSDTVTASGTNAQFIYENDSKNLWFDSNGSNAGGLTYIAHFDGATISGGDLGTNDFEFIA